MAFEFALNGLFGIVCLMGLENRVGVCVCERAPCYMVCKSLAHKTRNVVHDSAAHIRPRKKCKQKFCLVQKVNRKSKDVVLDYGIKAVIFIRMNGLTKIDRGSHEQKQTEIQNCVSPMQTSALFIGIALVRLGDGGGRKNECQ